MNAWLAVLFPTITGALMAGAAASGFDPVLLVITSPLIVAYPFVWTWDYVRQEES